MNYRVVDINGNPEYNLKGIKLKNSGNSFVYWTTKNSRNISEVIVYTDNSNIAAIQNNQICVSLHGIKDLNIQKECLKAFCDQLRVMGLDVKKIKFIFIVENKKEEPLINEVITSLGINGQILTANMNKKTDEKNHKIEEKIEEKFNKENQRYGDSNIVNITKYDNNTRKDIIYDEDSNTAYNLSQENLSMSKLMKKEYERLMYDPVESEKLLKMTDEEALKYVAKIVSNNRKKYYMDSNATTNTTNMTRSEKASAKLASKNDGTSNNELGIVKNSPNNSNDVSAIEENNDKIKEINPETSTINMNSSSNSTSSSEVAGNKIDNEDEKEREEINMDIPYYVADEGKVYNGNTRKEEPNLYCNEKNEIIDKNKRIVVGYNYGNYNEMPTNTDDRKLQETWTFHPPKKEAETRNKAKVKKLVKPKDEDFYGSEKSAAFVSLPVIIFIISLLLLIGSGIVWFITK